MNNLKPFSIDYLQKIFYTNKNTPTYIGSHESSWLEFKENFSFSELDGYARTMAAFANHSGGYIVFGIKNNPRKITGIDGSRFDTIEPAKITQGLNDLFSPEIEWESYTYSWKGKSIGLIYTYECREKPTIARKAKGEIKEADIYYRYHGRTERIKFPELVNIFSKRLDNEKNAWMDIF